MKSVFGVIAICLLANTTMAAQGPPAVTPAKTTANNEAEAVPTNARVYVVGNVQKPGVYPFDAAQPMTVLQALAKSEGMLALSAKKAYIYRKSGKTREEIEVDLGKILTRKSLDLTLQADDVLFIPGKVKRAMPGLGPLPSPFPLPVDWPREGRVVG